MTEVIGDMAYVSDDNLEACGEEISLIARTNTAVAAAANGNLDEGFGYNKDAGMLQCPAGELAMRVEKRTAKNGELKEAHGLRRAVSRGLFAMELQMYFTAFVANVKRITRLAEPITQ